MKKQIGRVVRINGIEGDNRAMATLWCPACDSAHQLWIVDPDKPAPTVAITWGFDGNLDHPTFHPSLLTQAGPGTRCHSFINDGTWTYLDDCDHALAGQTAPCVELPDWLREP